MECHIIKAQKCRAMQKKKPPLPIIDLTDWHAQGYTCLDTFPIAEGMCSVYSRLHPSQCKWEYQLMAFDNEGERRHLNPSVGVDSAPGIQLFVDMMIQGGILAKKPPNGHEWAICINDCNDYPSNFPSAALRELALAEICIAGKEDLIQDSFCVFEIYPDDSQVNDRYPSLLQLVRESLLRAKWNPEVKLRLSAWAGDPQEIEDAIQAGAAADSPIGPDGLNALHISAREGREEAVRALLENGANPRAVDERGNNALHWAALKGFKDICLRLLKDVDQDAKNNDRKTPLDLAAAVDGNEVEPFLRAVAARAAAVEALDKNGHVQPINP